MDSHDLDELFQKKLAGARTRKILSVILAAVLGLAVLGGAVYGISRLAAPGPAAEEPPPAASPTATPTPEPEASSTPAEPSAPPAPEPTDTPDTYQHRISITWAEELAPPEPVSIRVIHGEEILAEVELGPENDWTYVWEDPWPTEELSISGNFPTGAGASFVTEGDEFLLIGRYSAPEPIADPETGETVLESPLPQTGTDRILPILLLLLGAALIYTYFKLHARETRK